MDYVFAPSLHGPRQDSTLALHKCWADDGQRTARGAGGAPPPPLMVMVAAMLRRSTLDEVRVPANPFGEVTTYYEDPQSCAQRAVLLDLIAKDDVEAIEALQLAKVAPSACATKYMVPYLYQSLVWSVLELAAIVAWRTKSYRGLVAAVKRLAVEYRSLHSPPQTASAFCRADPSAYRGASPLSELCPSALQDIFNACCASMLKIDSVSSTLKPLDDVLRAHCAASAAACAKLPVGDVRALLERHRRAADHSGFLADVLAYVARGAFSAADARAALVELGHGDVGAMLFAAAPDSDSLYLGGVHAAARDVEFPTTLAQHPATQSDGSTVDPVELPSVGLMNAFRGDGSPVVHSAAKAVAASDTRHVLLAQVAAEAMASYPGAPAPYRSRRDFERHWKWQLRGLLGDGWDWSNCVAAGGSVVRALVGPDVDTTVPLDPAVTSFGDVDLFFYGLSYAEQRRRLQQLERHVRARVGAGRYAVLLTSRTATIVVEGAPRLQVALGRWSSLADVLSTCDVDCCGAGYDGRDVWLTGRAAAAYATRTNVAGAMGHVVRGSIAYEMRLWKYAARYGFAVLDPLHDAAVAAETRAELVAAATGGAGARSKVATARHVSTNLSGLRWLMAVDAGLLEPVDAVSDLAVGGPTTLAMVLAKVTAKGYMESDNYGTHEEGYVVAQEGGATDEEEPYESYRDDEGYFDWYSSLRNDNFAQCVALTDVDSIDLGTIDTKAWQL